MMEIIIALGHLVGAILASILIGLFLAEIANRISKKIFEHGSAERAIKLGTDITELDYNKLSPAHLQYLSERYSSELLSNRLSNFIGVIQIVWGWGGLAVQVIVFCFVTWNTFADSLSNAVFAWSIIAISIFTWIVLYVISFICYLLTGRFPGEAKQQRRVVSETMRSSTQSPYSAHN